MSTLAHQEYPGIESLQSKSHKNDIGSGVFKILNDIIFFDDEPSDSHDYDRVLGLENMGCVYKTIRADFLNHPYGLNKYKVIPPKANGSGITGEVLSTPLIGEPLIGFTETFISIGTFNKKLEAENALKYIKSEFARVMPGILKVAQDNPRDKWQKSPLQDFTINSEIDQQLYKKYCLDHDEVDFIDSKVKAME